MTISRELAETPGTDEWWAVRLSNALAERRERIEGLQAWVDGEPPIPWQIDNEERKRTYGRLLKIAQLNLAELIVSSTLYRVRVATVRSAVDSTTDGDDRVNELMLASDALAHYRQAIEWMLSLSAGYVLVEQVSDEWTERGQTRGRVTAEHPAEVITEADPANPARSRAAVKVYRDDESDTDVLVLWRPGYKRTAVKRGRSVIQSSRVPIINHFEWADVPLPVLDEQGEIIQGREETVPHEVPVYEFAGRFGMAEFEKHIPTMQRINHTILQRMILVVLQAFKQRGIKGVPNADPDGTLIDYDQIFSSDPDSLWILPAAAEIWESGTADIRPILEAVRDDIEALAIAAQAPLYALSSDAAKGSAAGAELQREGQIFKAEDIQTRLTPRIAAATSCMLRMSGEDERAKRTGLKVVWHPARRSSLSERAQAAASAKGAGVPWRTVMEKFAELTPSEVAEAEKQRIDDALMQSLGQTATAAAEDTTT